MFKKVLIGLAVAVMVILIAGMLFLRFNKDPNYRLKKIALPVKEGMTEEVSMRYNSMLPVTGHSVVFEFKPSETAEYEFTLSDITCDEDVTLRMTVMDENMSEYTDVSTADTGTAESGDPAASDESSGTYSCRVILQKKSTCYIGIDSESAENRSRYKWKCSFKVEKSPEEEKPADIADGQKVSIKLKPDEKKSLLFTPAETGYYKFDAEVVAGSKSGYAAVNTVTDDNHSEVDVTEGLCMLTAGTQYYIWVSAYDIRKPVDTEVSCRSVGSSAFDGGTEVSLTGESVIEYTADADGTIAIYSVSDGDPDVSVYDSDGFPLRNDKGSGAEISGNEHDFAVVIDASAGDVYRIFVSGTFTDCRIIRAKYKGDGSSLGPDDIEPIEITGEAPGDAGDAAADTNGNQAGSEEQQ